MEYKFILTAFGKDRPGIVAEITRMIYENGCNLEDSTMARLSDEFAMILLFSCREEEMREKLSLECRRLEIEGGLSAFIRPVEPAEGVREAVLPVRSLSVEGIDQAGIMYKVSRYLAQNAVNIVDLRSLLSRSPNTGEPFYRIRMSVEIPEGLSVDALRDGLDRIEDELRVDIRLD